MQRLVFVAALATLALGCAGRPSCCEVLVFTGYDDERQLVTYRECGRRVEVTIKIRGKLDRPRPVWFTGDACVAAGTLAVDRFSGHPVQYVCRLSGGGTERVLETSGWLTDAPAVRLTLRRVERTVPSGVEFLR